MLTKYGSNNEKQDNDNSMKKTKILAKVNPYEAAPSVGNYLSYMIFTMKMLNVLVLHSFAIYGSLIDH